MKKERSPRLCGVTPLKEGGKEFNFPASLSDFMSRLEGGVVRRRRGERSPSTNRTFRFFIEQINLIRLHGEFDLSSGFCRAVGGHAHGKRAVFCHAVQIHPVAEKLADFDGRADCRYLAKYIC